jgi:hypothetical protein
MKPSPAPFLAEPAPESAAVALFGKHPLAADHLEDTGLSTASLVAFKQGMYIEGIGECLSRQAWLKDLAEAESIPYDHHLFCVGTHGWLAARLTRSSDAAGRKQYPLVLALHSGNFALLHQIGSVITLLDECMQSVQAAGSLSELRQAPSKLPERLVALTEKSVPAPGAQARESWRQHLPGIGPDGIGLWRCCHALMPEGAAGGRARIPLHPGSPWPSAALWASFLSHLGVSKPLSIIWRHGNPFADIWLFPPGARVLANLFSSETSQPLTTQVPFNIPQPVRETSESSLTDWLQQTELFPKPADPGNTSLLNKVCHNVAGWFRPNTAK